MTTATVFDLRATIRRVLARSEETDPHNLGVEVLAAVPAEDTREALRQAITTIIRQEISLSRMRRSRGDTQAAPARPSEGPSRPVKNAAALVREAWRRHLHDRLPGAGGEWKFLSEFTVDDLEVAARAREDLASAAAAQAVRLRQLRKALADGGVDTVGDLPDDVLRDILDDEV